MKTPKATIKISNISNEKSNLCVEVIKGIENKKIPVWFVEKINSLTDEALWKNDFLMDYHTFSERIANKKWSLDKIISKENSLHFILDIIERSSFFEILCVTSVLDVPLQNIEIDDPFFGIYTPEK
ncbi:MAG: hypothetical protein Q4B43_08775 [Bacteroidota bacterium]|nr:hypothetical protein [Bacteroidota bacterium]